MPVTEVDFFYRAYRQPPVITAAAPMVYPTRGIGGETMFLAYAYTIHNDRSHIVAVFSNEALEFTVTAATFSVSAEVGSAARFVIDVERLATHVYRLTLDGQMTIGTNNYTLTAATSIQDIFTRRMLSTRRTWVVSGPDVCVDGNETPSGGAMILHPLRRDELSVDGSDTSPLTLRVTIDATSEDLTMALVANRWYWFAGDGQDDTADGGVDGRADLVEALFAALIGSHSLAASTGASVSMSSTNRITIAVDVGHTINLRWSHANTTLRGAPFGWSASDTGAAVSHTGNQSHGAWTPNRSDGSGWIPQVDSRDVAHQQLGGSVSLSGRMRISNLGSAGTTRDLEWQAIDARWALHEYADASEPTGTAEDVWGALGEGRPVRYYEDRTVRNSTSYSLYFGRIDEMKGSRTESVRRNSQYRVHWDAKFLLRGYL